MKKAKWLKILLAVIVIGWAYESWAVPPLPDSFYGTVKKDGTNVPDGTVVSAWIGGTQYISTTTSTYGADSVYSLNVPGDDPDTTSLKEGGVNGDIISFQVGSDTAAQTATFSSGATTNLNLAISGPGSLSITPSDGLNASGNQGGSFSPSSKGYTLQNTGGSSINWTASKGQPWVTLSSTGGTLGAGASTTVTVSINSNANSLTAGPYSDTVNFTNTTNSNGNTTRSVSLTVNALSGVLTVTPPDRLTSSGNQGGSFSPSSKGYTLQNTGGSSINWTASNGQSWVTLSSTGGTLGAGASTTVTVSINSNANSLTAGLYSDTVNFTNTTNSNGNTTRSVSLTVNAGLEVLTVTPPDGLTSSGNQGGSFSPSSKDYTLQNTGGSSINWTASKGQSWVTLSSTGGTLGAGASTTVTVSINSNANSLGVGSYSDTVTFSNATNGSGNTSRLVALVVSTTTQTFTVTTSPSGLQITVDGSTYTAPQSFSWAAGSSHIILVPSPQSGASGVRYVYASWSDGGAQGHSIAAPSSSAAYTANLTIQYSLITSVNPGGAGTVNPPGTTWYSSGQSVSVSATVNSGYTFSGWSGDFSGSTNPSSITMNGPKGITANFLSTKTNATSPNNISAPRTPWGPNKGTTGSAYKYSTGGSVSDLGDPVEYQFDWKGDGTDLSPWGSATQSETWTSGSTHYVRARARSSSDPSIVSDWSGAISVSVTEKPFISVTSPNAGETYLVGTTHPVTWTSGYLNSNGTVYLFYWYDRAWHPIAALPSTSTASYDWTIPDIPPGLESVIPNSRIRSTSIWIGNWADDKWECWGSSGSFKILYDGWIFTISGGDKGGAAIQFGEGTFGGHGISFEWGIFEIEGTYGINADGSMSGTYTIYDLNSSVLETGNFSGGVNSLVTAMTLRLNKSDGDSLFNMSGVRLLGEPVIPVDWKANISGHAQGAFDSLKIEPYQDQVDGDVYSRVFKVSGSMSIPDGPIEIEAYFFLTNAISYFPRGNIAYGIYTITGAISETGVFSGSLNLTSETFKFSAVSDDGNKYTFTGQMLTP